MADLKRTLHRPKYWWDEKLKRANKWTLKKYTAPPHEICQVVNKESGLSSTCHLKKRILNKPKTIKNATEQLLFLNGIAHTQISAFSIYLNNKLIANYCDTAYLKMRKLTNKNVKDYINDEKHIIDNSLLSDKGYVKLSIGKKKHFKIIN